MPTPHSTAIDQRDFVNMRMAGHVLPGDIVVAIVSPGAKVWMSIRYGSCPSMTI